MSRQSKPHSIFTVLRFKVTALVSDGAVSAAHTDANLKNPCGVAFNSKGFVWVADNGANVATLYDGNGVPQSLVVTIPGARTVQDRRRACRSDGDRGGVEHGRATTEGVASAHFRRRVVLEVAGRPMARAVGALMSHPVPERAAPIRMPGDFGSPGHTGAFDRLVTELAMQSRRNR
jgi:hypothetical protein